MASIKGINFYRVGKDQGCNCDRCGEYIRNIWNVEFTDGTRYNFGIDCFDKLKKTGNLSEYGKKAFGKLLKSIERHRELYEREKTLTEETDLGYKATQRHSEWESPDYWFGRPWEEYHEWMLNTFWQMRFKEDEAELKKFSKINFKK